MTNERPRAYAAAHFALELHGVDKEKLGMFRSIEGGGVKAEVMTYQNGGTYDRWRQLGKPKFEDIKLQVGMSMSEPFYTWIEEFFSGKGTRKNGAIIAADFYYKERARREFSDAMIKELVFPTLNATDKNTTYMNVTLGVEDIVFKPGSNADIQQSQGENIPAKNGKSPYEQRDWKACNFKFSLDGFADACSRVTKVDSFTVKQNLVEYASGGRRTVAKVPSAIDFPQLSFYLPEADAQPLFDHFTKRGVKGEVPGRLNGSIEAYDNSEAKTVGFSVTFVNADILNVAPDKSDATSEEIKQVKVDLYCESMKFSYKG
jgi:phage tail-like protein